MIVLLFCPVYLTSHPTICLNVFNLYFILISLNFIFGILSSVSDALLVFSVKLDKLGRPQNSTERPDFLFSNCINNCINSQEDCHVYWKWEMSEHYKSAATWDSFKHCKCISSAFFFTRRTTKSTLSRQLAVLIKHCMNEPLAYVYVSFLTPSVVVWHWSDFNVQRFVWKSYSISKQSLFPEQAYKNIP